MIDNLLNIEETTWNDVRNIIKPLNPTLFNIIDKISPGKEFKLYKAIYPYGDQILKNGKFYLPGKNRKLYPFDHPEVDSKLKMNLGYNLPTLPVLVSTKRSLELFVTLNDRVIPYFIINPGNMYGVWKVLDKRANKNTTYAPYNIWDMTSGARSLFMLPKIAERSGHSRLQKAFDFTLDKPDDLRDHWKIFSAIASHEIISDKWESEVVFFSKQWFEHLDDIAWRDFTLYLLDFNWGCTEFWRSQYSWHLTFSRIHSSRNITPNPYHADVVKHLLSIGVGSLPGFTPATNNDLAPISTLQKIYYDVYRLNDWAPIIMQPCIYDMRSPKRPVYYSLQYQTAIELTPSSNKRASAIEDAYMICALLEKYMRDLSSGNFDIEYTTLQEMTKFVNYVFFHSGVHGYSKLRENKLIPKEDVTFLKSPGEINDAKFPLNSTFFKGCIRIFKE